MTTVDSQCALCLHVRNSDQGYFCRAFPEGVPEGVVRNEVDHRVKHPEQTGNTVWTPPSEVLHRSHPLQDLGEAVIRDPGVAE